MAMINQEELNRIRSNVDIVDVISSYIPLTNRGRNYFGVCPFHDDHSPSMSVSKEKQIYTCFSCGATGNVFKFIMDYENISFLEAVKMMADKAGIALSIKDYKQTNNNQLKDVYEIYDISHKFYQNNIQTVLGKDAKEYLKERLIEEDLIKEFGIGLALKERDLLSKVILKKEYHDHDIVRSGLILKNEYGYVDMYCNRIMFPLWDLNGRVVGFSGRIYHGEETSKYINSKETEIFKKGELLYNYHRAKESARLKQLVIVMEGFMDVIRAYTIGLTNVVATMGTAVTKEQATLMKKMAKEIILCFDGDEAGGKATLSCIEELGKIGVVPKVVRLEENLDPDDYIKKYGQTKFLSKIEHPMNVMDFKLTYYKNNKDFNDPKDVANYVRYLIDDLSMIDDDILKEVTLKKMSEESNLDFEFLKGKLEEVTHKKEPTPKMEVPKLVVKRYNKYEKAQQNLIFYMLRSKEVIKIYHKKITYMPTENYRKLAMEISLFYKHNGYIEIADFMTYINQNEMLMQTLSQILCLRLKEEYTLDEIEDYLNVIRDYNIDYDIKRLHGKLKQEQDPMKKAGYLQQMMDLKVKGEKNNERN